MTNNLPKEINLNVKVDSAPISTMNSLTGAGAFAFANKMLENNRASIPELGKAYYNLSNLASANPLSRNLFGNKDTPSPAGLMGLLRERIDFQISQREKYANAPFYANKNPESTLSNYYGRTHQDIKWSSPRLLPAPEPIIPTYSSGFASRGIEGGGFMMYDPVRIANDLANANTSNPIGILDQKIQYRLGKAYKGVKRTVAQLKADALNMQNNGLMINPTDTMDDFLYTKGNAFRMNNFGGTSSSATFGKRNTGLINKIFSANNIYGGNSGGSYSPQGEVSDAEWAHRGKGVFSFRTYDSDKGANTVSEDIAKLIDNIFTKANSKVDGILNKAYNKVNSTINSAVGERGYQSYSANIKTGQITSKWVEGTGYRNPQNRALMGAAMVGAVANTAGSLAGNYGNYIMSRANVTGSFAANYYAGTANENFGNYLGGLVSSRSQFLQAQVRAGVTGAGQLAGAALLPAVGVEGIVGKVLAGAGLNSLAGGLGNMGASEINQYLQIAGAAYQQKAINLGNASVASGYYGMSRWGNNETLKNAIPAAWTVDGKKGIDLLMDKTLNGGFTNAQGKYQAYKDQPYFNQLSAFMQNSNVNPANLTNINNNFTNLRKLGITDTASAARLGSLSNIYGAVTGNYNGALTDLVGRMVSGRASYGRNFNLDTLQNSVRFQTIIGSEYKGWASDVAMRNQYFPEAGQSFNKAANSTYAQAITNDTIWKAAGLPGSYQRQMAGLDKSPLSTIRFFQGVDAKIATGDYKDMSGKEIIASQMYGNRGEMINTLISSFIADAKKPGATAQDIATAKSLGDDMAKSTYQDVMHTTSMTVNADNVTINYALGKAIGGEGVNSQFGDKFSPNWESQSKLTGFEGHLHLSPVVVKPNHNPTTRRP